MIGANFAKYVTSPLSHSSSSSHEQFANDEGRKGISEVHAEAGVRAWALWQALTSFEKTCPMIDRWRGEGRGRGGD